MNVLLMNSDRPMLVNGDFRGGRIPSSMGFSRASSGMRQNGAGLFENSEVNQPRFDWGTGSEHLSGLLYEPQSTNCIRNSVFAGAVAGAPGTFPNNMTLSLGSSGLSRSIDVGVERGLSYLSVRVWGVPVSSSYCYMTFETNFVVGVEKGDVWTFSSYMKLVSGSISNVTGFGFAINEYDLSSNWVGGATSAQLLTSDFACFATSRAIASSSASFIRPLLNFNVVSGMAVDLTLRLYHVQIEKLDFATTPIVTNGSSMTRAADQLLFQIPLGVSALTCVFDDNTYQKLDVSPGSYLVPTSLNRRCLRRIYST